MKFTLSWLKEFLDTEANAIEIVDKLNKIGLEVDDFVDYSEKYKNFYCVLVEETTKHPDSDHLNICKIKDKNNNILTIVCGAPNVKKDMKAILSPIGSCLPNGMEIKKTKIRGIESCGMLCSGKELEINDEHNGIIELDADVKIGTNAAEIFGLNDCVFEISITPNRADCLCVYGIARELAAAGIGKLKTSENKKNQETFNSGIKLQVEDENCPIFLFKEVKNLKNCESPVWLKKRLNAIGQNTRNALVDIGNYVMFTFNTPLHCYDADKINNKVFIHPAQENEVFVDLFDKKHILPKNATLISDDDKNLCLGGIIGGNTCGSSLDTKHVLVECAIFNAINTAITGRKINVQTDARYRFERGSDCNLVDFALTYTCNLIQEVCGGEISSVVRHEKQGYKEKIKKTIKLKLSDVKNLIGVEIKKEKILEILTTSGYKIEEIEDGSAFNLVVPSWKTEISVKEDIIDDIIRFYGYDKLEDKEFLDTKIYEKYDNKFNTDFKNKLYKIRKKLACNGMIETISYSFLRKNDNALFEENDDKLDLLNPIIEELSHMRQNILTNLMTIIKKNNNRGFENLSFFEIGNVFTENEPLKEKMILGGVRTGKANEKNIYDNERAFDVFDVKKDLFDVLKIFNINGEKIQLEKETPKYYHPSRSAALKLGKTTIAYFGEINPQVSKAFNIKERVMAFELFFGNLPQKLFSEEREKKAFIVNDLQPILRSFAFIIDKKIEVGKILNELYELEREFITNVKLFDLYQKDDKKSVAFTVTIQPKNDNLTKEEIDKISDKIVDFVVKKYDGVLRDGK